MLATGSVALPIPGVEFGGRVVDTWGAWSLPEMPKKMAVVGAGASGAEIASAYGRFGVEVTLIEMLDQVLPAEEKDVARVVERAFKKQNIDVVLGTKVEQVDAGKGSVKVKYGDNEAEVDYLCIAGGRAPDTEALKLADAGVETEESGRIKVDEYQRTTRDGGVRDRRPRSRRRARPQGLRGGGGRRRDDRRPARPTRSTPSAIAGATFCQPQVASFGLTEAEAKEAGREIKVGRFKLGGVGAGTVYDDRDGFVKIVADAEYGEILGAHIVGNVACDMIAELVDTRELEGGYQELARIIHPHPRSPRPSSTPPARSMAGRSISTDAGVDPYVLPPDLPRPVDDGAADHLVGISPPRPDASLDGGRRGRSRRGAATRWSCTATRAPGDRGSGCRRGGTSSPAHAAAPPRRAPFATTRASCASTPPRSYGLSGQTLAEQREFAARVDLPYPLLSDPGFALAGGPAPPDLRARRARAITAA